MYCLHDPSFNRTKSLVRFSKWAALTIVEQKIVDDKCSLYTTFLGLVIKVHMIVKIAIYHFPSEHDLPGTLTLPT